MKKEYVYTGQLHRMQALLNSPKKLDRFIGAFCSLNVSLMEDVLDDAVDCNHFSRYEFYSHFVGLTDQCHKNGDQFFRVHRSRCAEDVCMEAAGETYTFSGNFTGNYISLHVFMERDKIKSFYECITVKSPIARQHGSRPLFLSNFPF